jgi:hypothetical protein
MLETKLVLSTGMTTKNQLARTGIAVTKTNSFSSSSSSISSCRSFSSEQNS